MNPICDPELVKRYSNLIPLSFEKSGCIFNGVTYSPKEIDLVEKYQFQPNAILVASYPKSGTTWMLEILCRILNGERKPLFQTCVPLRGPASAKRLFWASFHNRNIIFPFIRLLLRLFLQACGLGGLSRVKSSERSKIVRTHLPTQLLPSSVRNGEQKLIYVWRNPKDTMVSFYHFHNLILKRFDTKLSWNEFFKLFSAGKVVFGSWFSHVKNYKKLEKENKNVLIVQFEAMKNDLPKEVGRIVDFLGIDVSEENRQKIAEGCQFESLKNAKIKENGKTIDMRKFMRKGVVGDWRKHFTVAQNRIFDKILAADPEIPDDIVFVQK